MAKKITPTLRKQRFDCWLKPQVKKWIEQIAKESRRSQAEIVEQFVEDRMIPKLDRLQEEKKNLICQANAIDEQIKFLEKQEEMKAK